MKGVELFKNKVLHIVVHMGGGIGNAVSSLVCSDIKSEHTIIVLQKPEKTIYVDRCLLNNIVVLIQPSEQVILNQLHISDVVIFHWWNHPLMNEFLIKCSNISLRSIVWCHVSGANYPYLPYSFLDCFEFILFTSKCSYENRWWSRKERESILCKSRVVYGMGPLEKKIYKNTYSIHERIEIGYVGTLLKSKIHPEFVNVCVKLINLQPNVHFTLLGDRIDGSWIIKKIREKGLEDKFSFLGYVEDVDKYLHDFDIFGYPLNPYNYATTENSILEAMSLGLPIVAMNQGTEKYIIDNEINGILCDNIESYADSILELINDEDKRESLGKRARKDVFKKFDFKSNINEFDNVLIHVMEKEKRPFTIKKVLGFEPYEWFLCFVNPEDKEILTRKKYAELETIYKGNSKASVFQFAKHFPKDIRLANLAQEIKEENA